MAHSHADIWLKPKRMASRPGEHGARYAEVVMLFRGDRYRPSRLQLRELPIGMLAFRAIHKAQSKDRPPTAKILVGRKTC
jgi:hypothetical protein